MAGITQEQQNMLNKLQGDLTNAKTAYNEILTAYAAAVNKQESCQAARDAKILGSEKNKACHIDTLRSLSANTANVARERDARALVVASAQAALDGYMAKLAEQAETEAATQAAALAGNAEYQLTQQTNILTAQQQALAAQLQQQTAESQSKLDAERSKSINKIILWSVVGLIGVILIIGGVYAYNKTTKSKPAQTT